MARLLDLEHFYNWGPLLPSNAPNSIPGYCGPQNCIAVRNTAFKTLKLNYSQSSSADAKLMHILPSQVPFPALLTAPGIDAVSISSILFRIPSGVRNPTIILGTPSRNDCIQNFISLRSKVIISLSFRMSALVFSSTQFTGLPSEGLASQTDASQRESKP